MKTALLVYTNDAGPEALRRATQADEAMTAALVRRLYPGWQAERADACELCDVIYPPEGHAYLGSFPEADVVIDRHWLSDNPSQLPEHLVSASAGRRLTALWTHSVVDWFAFAVWEDGRLVRALSLSPDSGIIENIGEPLAFELPYWSGSHRLDDGGGEGGEGDEGSYPLPFHPLELAEEEMEFLLGFDADGTEGLDGIDPYEIELQGFRLTRP